MKETFQGIVGILAFVVLFVALPSMIKNKVGETNEVTQYGTGFIKKCRLWSSYTNFDDYFRYL